MNWYQQAKEKLASDLKSVKGQREAIMKNAVKDALISFCAQDEEFAQAIVQGGSFSECMSAVARGVGNGISDLDAYKKAVSFYFPGAEIKCSMTIDLVGSAGRESGEPRGIVLDLADFF